MNINLTTDKMYTVSDVYYVSLQFLSNQNKEYICYPNNNNYLTRNVIIVSGSATFTFNSPAPFNTIAIYNSDKELLAHYFYDQTQNSYNEETNIASWIISLRYDRVDIIDVAPISVTDITSVYKEHSYSTDSLLGIRKTGDNEGVLAIHDNLVDLGVSTIRDVKGNADALIEKDTYLSFDGVNRISANETSDDKVEVQTNKYIVNKYNTITPPPTKSFNWSTSDVHKDLIVDSVKGVIQLLGNKVGGVAQPNIPSNRRLKPRVESYNGEILIQSFDEHNYPVVYKGNSILTNSILAPNFCITGVIGTLLSTPKYLIPLLNYYWAISNKLKDTCKTLGKKVWASPVPLYSGMNDAIFYSLLNLYKKEGYISDILVYKGEQQEVIQFKVIKRYFGESDRLELTDEQLYTYYMQPQLMLPNYKEKYHGIEDKINWRVAYTSGNTVRKTVKKASFDDLMPINHDICIGTTIGETQVRYIPWLAGNVFEEHILPKIKNGDHFEYNLYNTAALLLEGNMLTVICYTPYNNKTMYHRIPVEDSDTSIWIDNSILYTNRWCYNLSTGEKNNAPIPKKYGIPLQ